MPTEAVKYATKTICETKSLPDDFEKMQKNEENFVLNLLGSLVERGYSLYGSGTRLEGRPEWTEWQLRWTTKDPAEAIIKAIIPVNGSYSMPGSEIIIPEEMKNNTGWVYAISDKDLPYSELSSLNLNPGSTYKQAWLFNNSKRTVAIPVSIKDIPASVYIEILEKIK